MLAHKVINLSNKGIFMVLIKLEDRQVYPRLFYTSSKNKLSHDMAPDISETEIW